MSLQGYNSYNTTITIDNFHHAVLCISGNTQTIYLDGSAVATVTNTNILNGYSMINQIMLGCAGNKSAGFTGLLDDFRVYQYAMNPTQVSSLYANKSMVAYYPFDVSINGYTGNYASLVYDASFVGNATTTSTSVSGKNALLLSNPSSGNATSYVSSSSTIPTSSATNSFSVSIWFDATGNANQLMRLFDLSPIPGYRGLFIDISGTNTICSGYINPPILTSATHYLHLNIKPYTDIGTIPATITDTNTTVSTYSQKASAKTAGGIGSASAWVSMPITLPSKFTVCFWHYDVTGGSMNQALFSIAGTSYVLSVYNNDGGNNNCYIYFANGSRTTGYSGRPIGAWVHYAFTIDQTSNTLSSVYINGTLQQSVTVATPYTITSTNNILYLGYSVRQNDYTVGNNGYFYGLCTFSSILNATQITDAMNTTSANNPIFAGIVNPGLNNSGSGWTITANSNAGAYAALYGTGGNVLYGSFSGWAASPAVSPPYSTSYSSQLYAIGEYADFAQNVLFPAGSYTVSVYAGGRPGSGDGTTANAFYSANQVFQIYIDNNKVAQFTAPVGPAQADGTIAAGFKYVTANFNIAATGTYAFHFRVAQIGAAYYPTVAYTGITVTKN